MPAHNHSIIFTGRMLFLTPNQQCQRTEGNFTKIIGIRKLENLGYHVALVHDNMLAVLIEHWLVMES